MTRQPNPSEFDTTVSGREPTAQPDGLALPPVREAEATPTTGEVVTPSDQAEAAADAGSAGTQAVPSAPAAPRRKSGMRSLLLAGGAIAAIAAGAYYGHDYWTVGRFIVSTDDAYVQADSVTLAPRVSGYLSEVLVADNEAVPRGTVVARIDDRDYRVALDQAKANVEAAEATVEGKLAVLETQKSVIETARATITVDQADETFAEQENQRYQNLATSGYGSKQNAQNAASRIGVARASIVRDTAALDTAVRQTSLLEAEVAQARAALAFAVAARDKAELDLGYTTISAPVDGSVGNRTLRVGQFVQAGTPLMALVPSAAAFIVGNYKETQLTDVRRGQAVDVEIDMFPGRTYHGHVDSIAPASGQTFALLPPDNATGNFTKVVQRIPVRIVLDKGSDPDGDLRAGMSVTPSIDTRTGAAPTTNE